MVWPGAASKAMSHRTRSPRSPPYLNETSSNVTSAGADAGSSTAPDASATSDTLSRISSMRRSEASPAAHVFDSIVIITSGVIVVSR